MAVRGTDDVEDIAPTAVATVVPPPASRAWSARDWRAVRARARCRR
jgi:hypothetical protein